VSVLRADGVGIGVVKGGNECVAAKEETGASGGGAAIGGGGLLVDGFMIMLGH
jgi:hypothetical protein